MFRYIKIFFKFARISLMEQISYRTSFILGVAGKVIYMIVALVFLQAIFLQVPQIAGWDFNQAIFLFTIFSIVDGFCNVLFYRCIQSNLSWYIKSGDFDLILMRPINKLFYSSFEMTDIMDATSLIPFFALLIYIVPKLAVQFSIINIVIGILLIFSAIIFVYAITVIVGTTYFWVVSGRGMTMLANNLIQFARWPTDIYKGKIGFIFNFLLPISVIATVPVKVFLGQIDIPMIIFSFSISILFFAIALSFWQFGLKHYGSASS